MQTGRLGRLGGRLGIDNSDRGIVKVVFVVVEVDVEVVVVGARRRGAGRFGRHGGFVAYMRSAPAKGGEKGG